MASNPNSPTMLNTIKAQPWSPSPPHSQPSRKDEYLRTLQLSSPFPANSQKVAFPAWPEGNTLHTLVQPPDADWRFNTTLEHLERIPELGALGEKLKYVDINQPRYNSFGDKNPLTDQELRQMPGHENIRRVQGLGLCEVCLQRKAEEKQKKAEERRKRAEEKQKKKKEEERAEKGMVVIRRNVRFTGQVGNDDYAILSDDEEGGWETDSTTVFKKKSVKKPVLVSGLTVRKAQASAAKAPKALGRNVNRGRFRVRWADMEGA